MGKHESHLTMTDASGTTNYGYDSMDRLTSKATPEGTLNYTYDAASVWRALFVPTRTGSGTLIRNSPLQRIIPSRRTLSAGESHMSDLSAKELAFLESIQRNAPATTLSPGPGPNSSNAKAALRRCCAAWQRAFKACKDDPENSDDKFDIDAARAAAEAYCNAMPLLAGYEGVRDFIACAAHGILIGAIPPEKSSQLLYAAQVALGSLHFERHLPKSPSE